MRLPDQILNTVCFIAQDPSKIKYGGTGFIVAVRGAYGNAYLHLVTAKHVAEAVEGAPFAIGVNTRHGTKAVMESSQLTKWWYHPTEPKAVDAAVTLFAPPGYETLDIEWVYAGDESEPGMFATPDVMQKNGIGIGDEIAVVGLFSGFSGKDRHFAIVRTGNLAMLPSERIPVEGFDPMEAYLAEGRSIGGLSGSPVYVRQTININLGISKERTIPFAGTGQIYFLGLMVGAWRLPKGFLEPVKHEAMNMGISTIVPAHKILEVIYQPELIQMRKEYDQKISEENKKQGIATVDSSFDKPAQSFTRDDFENALKKASRKVTPESKK
jgi:hypothetical protein